MKYRRCITRRELTGRLGIAAGLATLNPVLAIAKAIEPTPVQVEGPFYPVAEQADKDLDLTRIKGHTQTATGEIILVRGQVFGTHAQPLKNAMVDVWQANHYGRYDHPEDKNPAPLDPHFQGWGLVKTDADGWYNIKTIKPAPYSLSAFGESGWRPRHIHFKVSRPGFELITTQMYFRGDPLIAREEELLRLSEAGREALISDSTLDAASGLPVFRFDVVLAAT
ncbi:MAG: protocatechuate 3,4-dioxygenase [Gammaproteobacteria bacterium]|nr:protocatechuate 3,4-dioxygenase [Gammaproteobacteria bacterium]